MNQQLSFEGDPVEVKPRIPRTIQCCGQCGQTEGWKDAVRTVNGTQERYKQYVRVDVNTVLTLDNRAVRQPMCSVCVAKGRLMGYVPAES